MVRSASIHVDSIRGQHVILNNVCHEFPLCIIWKIKLFPTPIKTIKISGNNDTIFSNNIVSHDTINSYKVRIFII